MKLRLCFEEIMAFHFFSTPYLGAATFLTAVLALLLYLCSPSCVRYDDVMLQHTMESQSAFSFRSLLDGVVVHTSIRWNQWLLNVDISGDDDPILRPCRAGVDNPLSRT